MTTVPTPYTRGRRRNPHYNPPETIPVDKYRFNPPQDTASTSDDTLSDEDQPGSSESRRSKN